MTKVKLRGRAGKWEVVGEREGLLTTSAELEWAALDALLLAELRGTTVELAEGVPEDALELGRRLRRRIEVAGRWK